MGDFTYFSKSERLTMKKIVMIIPQSSTIARTSCDDSDEGQVGRYM